MEHRYPSISVIIPVFNGAPFLAEAVASIHAQQIPVNEIIIVDDGSTDETAAVAAGLGKGLRYIYQPNQGPHAAQNTGLALAQGEVIAFLDADDRWPTDKLSVQLPLLLSDLHPAIVLGFLQYIRLRETAGGKCEYLPFLEPFFGANCFGAALFRRETFAKVGQLDGAMTCGGDVDWFLRAREQGLVMAAVSSVTLFYRLHPGNITRHKTQRDHFLLQALKQSLDRRRASDRKVADLSELPRPRPDRRK
ncbi:MAG: glycosyltransferase family 2 protein [Candidatus Aminicenantes bacterium]|nr:glycosyltransferase family 2 protein [Candidatus Aminicenantes bacterium]